MLKTIFILWSSNLKFKCLISSQSNMQVVNARDVNRVQANVNLSGKMFLSTKRPSLPIRDKTYKMQKSTDGMDL